MKIAPDVLIRFVDDLARLLPGEENIGVAVSGGPDSLALLILAAEARPGRIEAATVDHRLRAESAAEARMVADACATLRIPHTTLAVTVPARSSLQAQARDVRYAALADWAKAHGLAAVLTAHHADDQAETILLRLARGAGLGGLAGVRPTYSRAGVLFARPLLSWRKTDLEGIVAAAKLLPIDDPANADPRHDRSRVRGFLAGQDWLDPERLAASASHLAEAEEALAYCAERILTERSSSDGTSVRINVADLPRELQRRLLLLAFARLDAPVPRGPDLDRAMAQLIEGGSCTLSGLKLSGGETWRVAAAPRRR